jgi:hypothetical protein
MTQLKKSEVLLYFYCNIILSIHCVYQKMAHKSRKEKDFITHAIAPLPNWLYDTQLEKMQEKGFVSLLVDLKIVDTQLESKGILNRATHIIRNAISGDFSFFDSKSDNPMTDLHTQLTKIGSYDLAQKVTTGKYNHYWVFYKK